MSLYRLEYDRAGRKASLTFAARSDAHAKDTLRLLNEFAARAGTEARRLAVKKARCGTHVAGWRGEAVPRETPGGPQLRLAEEED